MTCSSGWGGCRSCGGRRSATGRHQPRRIKTADTPAGYSGKPLAEKLGIKAGTTVIVIDAPPGYRKLLGSLPARARVETRDGAGRGPRDFIHCFAATRRTLATRFPVLERALAPAGMLWISWPKGTSRVTTDLTESMVREIGLATGLVDVKVCAVDETWSGLKFVRRVKDRVR